MDKQKLPNANFVLTLGLLSIATFWLFGVLGLILSIIAFKSSNNAIELYKATPEKYSNFSTLAIGRILAGIGFMINAIYLIFVIYIYSVVGIDNMDAFEKNLKVKKEYIEQHQ